MHAHHRRQRTVEVVRGDIDLVRVGHGRDLERLRQAFQGTSMITESIDPCSKNGRYSRRPNRLSPVATGIDVRERMYRSAAGWRMSISTQNRSNGSIARATFR